MMDIAFLTCLWYFFNTLGSTLEGGALLDFFHNLPKVHGCQKYFDFKLPKVGVCSIRFVNESNGLAIK